MPTPASATLRQEEDGKSDSISSVLYDIIYGEDGITMPMDAVKDELVENVWKLDSPLVKVRILTLYVYHQNIFVFRFTQLRA